MGKQRDWTVCLLLIRFPFCSLLSFLLLAFLGFLGFLSIGTMTIDQFHFQGEESRSQIEALDVIHLEINLEAVFVNRSERIFKLAVGRQVIVNYWVFLESIWQTRSCFTSKWLETFQYPEICPNLSWFLPMSKESVQVSLSRGAVVL